MGQFPQDGENGQNVVFFGALLWPNGLIFLLRCYCREPNHHVGDYPYNAHGTLKWNLKSLQMQQVELFWCNCAWNMQMSLMINRLRGKMIHPQDDMLQQPQICETDSDLTWTDLVWCLLMGRGGTIKFGQFLGPSNCRERIQGFQYWS